MAGGENTWKGKSIPGIDDGILTAYEVSNMYLPATKLVVLSACETGVGDIHGSEGVYGLQRAFKIAGVKYLLMSLWEVPDTETSEFMRYFYENLFNNQPVSDAFHAAQEKMRKKYSNEPYKWGAWILVR
jgi:CHAT domain-containing protein